MTAVSRSAKRSASRGRRGALDSRSPGRRRDALRCPSRLTAGSKAEHDRARVRPGRRPHAPARPATRPCGPAGACATSCSASTPTDYDVATSARPEQVRPLFRRTIAIGASFGVVEVHRPAATTASGSRSRSRRSAPTAPTSTAGGPRRVVFSSPEEDAQRRDFTINGMFFDPVKGELIDYVGGQADLDAKVLRAIGDPHARFTEDKLRILRAVRMADAVRPRDRPRDARRRPSGWPREIRVVVAERDRGGAAEDARRTRNRARGHAAAARTRAGRAGPAGAGADDARTAAGAAEPRRPATCGSTLVRVLEAALAETGRCRSRWRSRRCCTTSASRGRSARTADRYTFHGHEHVGERMAGEIADAAEAVERRGDAGRVAGREAPVPCGRPDDAAEQAQADPGSPRHRRTARAAPRRRGGERQEPSSTSSSASGCCGKTPPEELNPPPVVTGDDLIELGWKQGPLFKTVLDAVREAQTGREGQRRRSRRSDWPRN